MTRTPHPRRPWSPDGVRVEAGPRPHRRPARLDPVAALRLLAAAVLIGSTSGLALAVITDPDGWVWALAVANVAASTGFAARLAWLTRRRP